MSRAHRFHLTRRAARDLRTIHRQSAETWGRTVAKQYLEGLYAAMGMAAATPESGRLRQHRSAPFLMVAAGRHFVLYDRVGNEIVVLAIIHQARDIETLVQRLTSSFLLEIERLKSRIG